MEEIQELTVLCQQLLNALHREGWHDCDALSPESTLKVVQIASSLRRLIVGGHIHTMLQETVDLQRRVTDARSTTIRLQEQLHMAHDDLTRLRASVSANNTVGEDQSFGQGHGIFESPTLRSVVNESSYASFIFSLIEQVSHVRLTE